MPRLAGYRGAVKKFLRDLRSLDSERSKFITPAVTDALEVQERENDEVDEGLLQAAHQQNQSLPVNLLPNELLIQIFLLVRGSRLRKGGEDNPAWRTLMLVCRFWHDVVLASPVMWCSFDIGLNAHWTHLALTRSNPATVNIHMRSNYVSQEQIDLISPHAHRIRRLVFSDGVDAQWSSALHTLLDRTMPALEAFSLSMKPHRAPKQTQPTYLHVQLSSAQSPRLQSLSLSHVVMPRDPLLFSKLRILTLKKCECDYSLDQFLDVLSTCTVLRKFCLLSFLSHLTDNPPSESRPTSQRTSISLPRLAIIILGHHPPNYTSHFLARLLLPANVQLAVYADAPIPRLPADGSALDALPQNRATVLPVLRAVNRAELQVQGRGYYLRGATRRSGEKCAVELGYHPTGHGPGRRDLLLRGLADLVSAFRAAPLRFLSIRGLSVAVTQAKWREVLDAFPRLRELRVNDDGPMVALVGALHSESPEPSSVSGHGVDTRRRSLLPCPHLGSLTLELECDMYGPFLDMVLECMQRRAEKGVRLHKLELRSLTPADAVQEDWLAFVRGLEGVVSDVSYRHQVAAATAIAGVNSVLHDL